MLRNNIRRYESIKRQDMIKPYGYVLCVPGSGPGDTEILP